jgi:biopolymer transport protein ExbD
MRFQRRRKEKLDISITSMIDVVFLLLIFFMVTTTFQRHTQVKIKLPEANGAQDEGLSKNVTMTIDTKGDFYLADTEGESLKLPDQRRETLIRELSKLGDQAKNNPFVINADGRTPHQSVMTVLDVAGQIGFNQITFAAQEPQQKEE